MEVPTGHGETILIVDDEPAIREVAMAVLSKSGYKVLVAEDGPSALALFVRQSKKIDVVLTDVVMPIMSGLVLARTLRKMGAKAKIIVSGARDSDYNPGELPEIGVQGFLNKPYSRETLLRAIDRVLHNDRGKIKCRPLRILVADDHEVMRKGVRALIEHEPGWQVCGTATNGEEVVETAKKLKPEVLFWI